MGCEEMMMMMKMIMKEYKTSVKDLQEQGTEPTDWVSALSIVNKPSAKNGIRVCIDSRNLNTVLKPSEYSMPTVDLLTEKSNAKKFTLAKSSLLFSMFHWMNLCGNSQMNQISFLGGGEGGACRRVGVPEVGR